MHVFVYGTLKANYGNHRLLTGSTFVSAGHTKQSFLMFSAGAFPVACDQDVAGVNPRQVSGELYEITPDTLRQLDRLEGYPTMYDRQETEIDVNGTGVYQTAWMYVGAPDYWQFGRMTPCDLEEGMWIWR